MTDPSLSGSPGRDIEAACRDCGAPLALNPWDERPVRCEPCFDGYLRAIDLDFLASYGKLGVISRRTVAETCLRALVLEMPPARKVLAMTIVEQFLLSSADLIGLYRAIRGRGREPVMRSFLAFRLDAESSANFFAELRDASDGELFAGLGLPAPGLLSTRYPAIDRRDAQEIESSLHALVRDLRSTAERGSSALLLAQIAGHVHGGPGLTEQSSWLSTNGPAAEGLRPDQVASLVLDERRRRLVVQAVPVDEDQLAQVVDAIDCMTRASSNMIYAYLTVQDEEARLRALAG